MFSWEPATGYWILFDMPPASKPISDEELVARLLEGDRTAGDMLWKRHHRLVAKSVFEVTGDLHAVEDLMQEIFFKAFRKSNLYNPKMGKFTSWLVTVARNEALNYLRRRRRTPHVSLEDTNPEGGFSPMESPSKQVSKREVWGQMLGALNELKDPARTILKMRMLESKSFDQIAKTMRQPVDTVKTIFYRTMEQLRNRLNLPKI